MNISSVSLSVHALLAHGDWEDKEFGLNEGRVHTEYHGQIALVDILYGVALGKAVSVELVGHGYLAHKGKPLVDLVVCELQGYLVVLMLDEREGAHMYEAVDVTLRPVLVERKRVVLAFKSELTEVGSVSREKNGRALKIGVYAELCLIDQRNENVLATMSK